MKSLIQYAVPGCLLIFVCWCPAQTAPKAQQAQPKAAPSIPAPAKEKAPPKEEEEIPPADPNALFPAVVARVDGKPILGRDLETLVRRELAANADPEWKDLREEYRGQLTLAALNTLINNRLLYQKAVSGGIKATDAEVQAEMEKISKSFGSDAEMNRALAAQMTDRATLEKNLYESVTIAKFIEENINKKVTVSQEEISKYYTGHLEEFQHPDVVRTSHILIPAGETAQQDALAKKRADSILERAKKGEDFAKLAKEYSIDETASRGGDIGYNAKDQLVPEYGEAAFSLPVGGVQLIKTSSGYHIIKVTDKKKEGLYPLEEIKDQLGQFLKAQKAQAEYNKLINQLRDQALIEVLIPAGQPLKP